uniref:Transposase Helix-turn-helix domain-containing protein n=1 Tax=Photinus pyralis TaxID=7054 RepID=A0A1Y1KE69_PHOPY
MDDDVQISAAAFIILCDAIKKKQRKRRRYWMTNLFKSRNIYSGSNLLNDLSLSRTGQFKNFCRISCEDFEYLIHLIGHKIAKQETTFRQPIPVKERLAVTLRFLATGDSYTSLMYLFKISKQSISTIVTEVCQALCDALKDYVKVRNIAFIRSVIHKRCVCVCITTKFVNENICNHCLRRECIVIMLYSTP